MEIPYVPPTYRKDAFNCPFCKAYAEQIWFDVAFGKQSTEVYQGFLENHDISACRRCKRAAIWRNKQLIFPPVSPAPMPSADMPDDVKADYLEAGSIVNASPRAACALLRLAIQKLMLDFGEKGKDLNEHIRNLVAKGLPVKIQKALDSVRVIGNEAVHPGTLDLKDDISTANSIFSLVNMTIEVMISQPKEIESIYEKLPEKKKKEIAKRDGK